MTETKNLTTQMYEEINRIKKIQAFHEVQITQLYRDILTIRNHFGLVRENEDVAEDHTETDNQ